MTAEAALISRTFAVGDRYRCTLTVPKVAPGAVSWITAEWEPAVPGELSAAELQDYESGRDAVLAEALQMVFR